MKTFVFLVILVKITFCAYDKRIITTSKYSKYNVAPTIVNGKPATKGQMPYFVSIIEPVYRTTAGSTVWMSLCGGSIISESKVLTAAHCFEGNDYYFSKHPDILRLVAGNTKQKLVNAFRTNADEQAQWRKIKRVALHHDFAFPEYDIALISVEEPWNFTKYVDYATLATRSIDYPSSCYSTGFGKTGHNLLATITPVLLQARIDVMARWKCSAIYEMDMGSFICTDSTVSDVGVGDSGGPLTCKFTLDPAEVPERHLLVGVVSGKNYDKTSLFTRVSSYGEWIAAGNSIKLTSRRLLILIFITLHYE